MEKLLSPNIIVLLQYMNTVGRARDEPDGADEPDEADPLVLIAARDRPTTRPRGQDRGSYTKFI